MKLLAWDTSSKSGAIAALEWDAADRQGWAGVRLVGEWSINVDAAHSERLMWGIHTLLESAGWKLDQVDVFGVGVGPGSFTGLRIGVTTARTLAHTLGKPLVGVSSLAALARPAALWLGLDISATPEGGKPKKRGREKAPPVVLVAATDAAKGELFSIWGAPRSIRDCVALAGGIEGDQPGLWKRGVEEQVLAPPELIKAIQRKMATDRSATEVRWAAVGEGRKRYADAWTELPAELEVEIPVPFRDQVQGRYVAMLAWEAYQAGLAREALTVHPRYARAADAEIKLKAGLLKKAPTHE